LLGDTDEAQGQRALPRSSEGDREPVLDVSNEVYMTV
jgi:hypothetical protein